MNIKKISVVLCTYNEANYVKDSISKLQQNIQNLELIIVDDDSSDDTREIINNLNNKNDLKLIHRKKSRGLASAFLTGIVESSGDYIGWTDTNMSELTTRFKEMITVLDSNYDIVILSRYVNGGGDNRTLLRSLCSKYFNFVCRIMLGSKIKDYTSGIFLMRREVLNEVNFLAYGHGEFFIEFLANANKKGYRIKEIPFVQKKDDDLSVSKTGSNIFTFLYLGFFYFLRIIKTLTRRN